MTEHQLAFVKVAKQFEILKKELELVASELSSLLGHLEVNSYFQDEETDCVYKIVKPKGKFVQFKDLDYVRTALPDEFKGSLSRKEASEKGFLV